MADSRPKPANKTPPKSPGEPAKDKAAKRLSLEAEGAGEGAAAAGAELSALEEAFRKFAVHGDARASGREMHGKNWSKLCRDCQVIDGRSVTVTDVDIVFSKIKCVPAPPGAVGGGGLGPSGGARGSGGGSHSRLRGPEGLA